MSARSAQRTRWRRWRMGRDIVSVWQLLFYAWKYAVTRLVVVGRRAIRYRGFGCAGGEEDWLEAHLLLFDL